MNFGKLQKSFEAMITVVRGALVGKTVYWIARNYCGMKSSVIEADILD
ncbi:MAG: hypothetical protein IJN21_09585 [Clostridia bacterium]|nr:hypothetical protein [Clostridia bacterium]